MGEYAYAAVYTQVMFNILHFTVVVIYNLILTCCSNYFVFTDFYFYFGQDPWQHPQVPFHLQMLLQQLCQGRLDKLPDLEG